LEIIQKCVCDGEGVDAVTGTFMIKDLEGSLDTGTGTHFLTPKTSNSVNEGS
jgi:hypothetical protein